MAKLYNILTCHPQNAVNAYDHKTHKLLKRYNVGDRDIFDVVALGYVCKIWVDYDERYGDSIGVDVMMDTL